MKANPHPALDEEEGGGGTASLEQMNCLPICSGEQQRGEKVQEGRTFCKTPPQRFTARPY